MKKALLLSATLLLTIITNAQIVNIPDANFKNALLNHDPIIDTNEDGEIQVSEAEAFDETIYVFWNNISDLTGIEAFINITELICWNNQLTSLNLSNNIALTFLDCNNNDIEFLNLSNNLALSKLSCTNNQLTSLDVSNNTNLEELVCKDNQITSLNLTNNIDLTHIYCSNNQITSLDLSSSTTLTCLICRDNQLTFLNLKNGNNTNLSDFKAYDNPNLTCIEVDEAEWSTDNWTLIDPQTSFSENCIVGIADIETLTDLTISPNPFTDRVEVALEKHSDYEIRLLDILGKELFSTQFNGTSYTLSTSELPKGTYLMHISSKDGVRVEKVVKQ